MSKGALNPADVMNLHVRMRRDIPAVRNKVEQPVVTQGTLSRASWEAIRRDPSVLAALSKLEAESEPKVAEEYDTQRVREERMAINKARKAERDESSQKRKFGKLERAMFIEAVNNARQRHHRLHPDNREREILGRSVKQESSVSGHLSYSVLPVVVW